MKLGSKETIFGVLGTAVLCLATVAPVVGQTAPAKKPSAAKTAPAAKPATRTLPVGTAAHPLLADQAFHNIKVFKGVSAVQFMDVMGFFSASLVETCTFCHSDESDGSWPHYADDTNPIKNTAREMVRMTNGINTKFFQGRQVVTCYSCHNGSEVPKSIPTLSAQYAVPQDFEPDEIDKQFPNAPLPDQIFDKYIAAIGGAERVGALTSYVAKGTYGAYSASEKGTVEILAKAPNQRAMIIHTDSGDTTTAFNGMAGWNAGPDETTPLPLVALSGPDLDGVKADALLSFPARYKQALTKWRTGAPFHINGQQVQVVQGMTAGGAPVKLYFDSKTGLLVREVRFIKTPVGRNPYQVDYSDYRDVSGIKMPFHIVITWTDGRNTLDLTSYEFNVPIDAARFGQPPRPKTLEVASK